MESTAAIRGGFSGRCNLPEVRKGLCRSALDLTDGRNYFAFAVLLDGELIRLTGFTLGAVGARARAGPQRRSARVVGRNRTLSATAPNGIELQQGARSTAPNWWAGLW